MTDTVTELRSKCRTDGDLSRNLCGLGSQRAGALPETALLTCMHRCDVASSGRGVHEVPAARRRSREARKPSQRCDGERGSTGIQRKSDANGLAHELKYVGTWCSGITPAQHAGGPGFNPQCVHLQMTWRVSVANCGGSTSSRALLGVRCTSQWRRRPLLLFADVFDALFVLLFILPVISNVSKQVIE